MRNGSKILKVKEYLEKNKTITSWDAIQMFRATRLSAIIYDLRHKYGMNIITESMKGQNSNYGKYILLED